MMYSNIPSNSKVVNYYLYFVLLNDSCQHALQEAVDILKSEFL